MFKAYDNEPEAKEVYFRVVSSEGRVPKLIACTRTGFPINGGSILWILEGGVVKRCLGVSPELGLQLDDEGRVVFDPEVAPKSKSITLAEIKQMLKKNPPSKRTAYAVALAVAAIREELDIAYDVAEAFVRGIRW